jgi:hypothetical protein
MQRNPPGDLTDRWVQLQRRNHSKSAQTYACVYCSEWRTWQSADALYNHGLTAHPEKILQGERTEEEKRISRKEYEAASLQKGSADIFLPFSPSLMLT